MWMEKTMAASRYWITQNGKLSRLLPAKLLLMINGIKTQDLGSQLTSSLHEVTRLLNLWHADDKNFDLNAHIPQ